MDFTQALWRPDDGRNSPGVTREGGCSSVNSQQPADLASALQLESYGKFSSTGHTVRHLEKKGAYNEGCLPYLPWPKFSVSDRINYPPPGYLRQQTIDAIFGIYPFLHQPWASYLWADRTQLPELNKKTVEVRP